MTQRTFTYQGEELVVVQSEYEGQSFCLVHTAEGEPVARLSVKLADQTPAPGYFYLRWWSENEDIVSALLGAGILQSHPTRPLMQISSWVQTQEVRVVPEEKQGMPAPKPKKTGRLGVLTGANTGELRN
jgi:hypothetical protein